MNRADSTLQLISPHGGILKDLYQAYHAAFSYPGEVQAPRVTQPVLILNTHGSLAAQTRALAPYFHDATLVEIPELHHGVFDVGADILAEKARPFLDAP